jgi:L-iditol 2-dehydrogenase
MDDTLLAVRLHGPGDLRAAPERRPVPRPGESLVRVTSVGICGSDLHWFSEGGIGDARLDRPVVPGHEAAGVIAAGPRAGQRVAIDPAAPCGRCEMCLDGRRNLCPTVGFLGHGSVDGALRQYLTWPDPLLHPMPDSLSDNDIAMLEPLGVAIHSVDLGHQRVGGTVAVVGCGPIGLCLLQVARAAGAWQVLAVEPLAHRAEAARRFGADVVLPHEGDAFVAALAEHTGGRGVDVVYEAAGNDAAIELALRAARPGGRVVLVGIPDADSSTFTASLARRKGLSLVLVRRMGEVYPRAARLVGSGRVDVRLVSHAYPLTEAPLAFRVAAAREGLKVVVNPTDGA